MPLMSEIHRDRALENISVMYKNDRLIADALVPSVGVTRESDIYYIYTKDHFRLPKSRRANKAESNRSTWHASTSSYLLQEEALHDFVSQRDRDNADAPIQPDIDTTEALTEQILIRKEYDLASLMTTTNWANSASLSAGLNWSSNTAGSNPITIIDSVTSVIAQNSGKLPNKLVLSDVLFRKAKEHVSIVDHIKYTSADSVTPDMLARLFNVATVLVAGAIYNTGGEGVADSMSFIWPAVGCFLSYMEPSPGLRKVSAMYRFDKRSGTNSWLVTRWPEPRRGMGTEGIEVSTMYQYKPVATDCAYLLNIS